MDLNIHQKCQLVRNLFDGYLKTFDLKKVRDNENGIYAEVFIYCEPDIDGMPMWNELADKKIKSLISFYDEKLGLGIIECYGYKVNIKVNRGQNGCAYYLDIEEVTSNYDYDGDCNYCDDNNCSNGECKEVL